LKKETIKKEKEFQKKIIILTSNGLNEKVAKDLLIKHNGDLLKVLNDYHSTNKPKDFKVNYSKKS